MNSNDARGVAVMDSGADKGNKYKSVLIIAALILANIIVASVVLSWRL